MPSLGGLVACSQETCSWLGERYERAAARWIAKLIVERPRIQLSEIELVAAGFREAWHGERGVDALRSCL